MLNLTDRARTTLERLTASGDQPRSGLRIAIDSGGCVGLVYRMALVDGPDTGDVVVPCGTTRVYVDPASVALISGTTIDFVESVEGVGFSFDNPNAAHKCACGKSFAA